MDEYIQRYGAPEQKYLCAKFRKSQGINDASYTNPSMLLHFEIYFLTISLLSLCVCILFFNINHFLSNLIVTAIIITIFNGNVQMRAVHTSNSFLLIYITLRVFYDSFIMKALQMDYNIQDLLLQALINTYNLIIIQ